MNKEDWIELLGTMTGWLFVGIGLGIWLILRG